MLPLGRAGALTLLGGGFRPPPKFIMEVWGALRKGCFKGPPACGGGGFRGTPRQRVWGCPVPLGGAEQPAEGSPCFEGVLPTCVGALPALEELPLLGGGPLLCA